MPDSLQPPEVSVLIVNFRTKELTADAVASALEEPECLEVVVVDNDSGDGSVEFLIERFSSFPVEVVASEVNEGFGAGNNRAAKAAKGPYLFLLNSDAVIQPGCLGRLLPRLKAVRQLGIVAPQVYLGDGKTPQPDATGFFPSVSRLITRKTKAPDNSPEPEWVTGAAMLVRKEEFLALGGFDEEIFMYFEDVLLCWRYRQRGLKIQKVAEAGVTHLGGASASGNLQKKARYYAAQDVLLRKMGTSEAGILLVRLLRWPNLLIGRLLGRN